MTTFSAAGFDHDDWVELVFTTGPFRKDKGFENDVRIIDEPNGMTIMTDGLCIDLSIEERNALRDYFFGKLSLIHAPEKEASDEDS